MRFLDSDSYEVRAFRSGLLEGIPFIVVERRPTVNEELFGRLAVLFLEGVEHLSN
jgi:hypothetical protein